MKPLTGKRYLRFLQAASEAANRFPMWMLGERAREHSREIDQQAPSVPVTSPAELAELHRRDSERLVWWFSHSLGTVDISKYLNAIHEGYNIDQWRAFIDEAMNHSK